MSGRAAAYAAYAVIAVAVLAWQAYAVSRGSLPLGRLLAWLLRRRVVRMGVVLGWAWLGWHLFARGSATFLH